HGADTRSGPARSARSARPGPASRAWRAGCRARPAGGWRRAGARSLRWDAGRSAARLWRIGAVPASLASRRRLLGALAATAVPLPAAAQPARVTIRLSHVVTRQTPKGLTMERFQQNVQQASAGRIQVVIYPNSLLYGDADEMQALQLG